MSPAKVVAACLLTAVSLSACGVAVRPVAGSKQADAHAAANVTNPTTKHLTCLKQHGITARRETLHSLPAIQVKTRPAGPTIIYTATPGAAQNEQITGQAQGAEVIGAALVYPNQAPNALMSTVENCIAEGVSG